MIRDCKFSFSKQKNISVLEHHVKVLYELLIIISLMPLVHVQKTLKRCLDFLSISDQFSARSEGIAKK